MIFAWIRPISARWLGSLYTRDLLVCGVHWRDVWQVSLAQMASRMATYMEVTPASPQKRLQAMGYSMLQLHLTSHLALISKTSQRKATVVNESNIVFGRQWSLTKDAPSTGDLFGNVSYFCFTMFYTCFAPEIFSSGSLCISPFRSGRNLACHELSADNLKLCNCMCSRWKPRSGISPPQPQHFMTQVTEWPALQQKNVHIISKIEFPNAIEGWRIVFCIQHLFIMWKLNYRNISRSDCIRLWSLVKMWAATGSCAEDMFLHDKNGHICSFADRAGQ